MKYTETGFRALYHNFAAFPINEKYSKRDYCAMALLYGESFGIYIQIHFCGGMFPFFEITFTQFYIEAYFSLIFPNSKLPTYPHYRW